MASSIDTKTLEYLAALARIGRKGKGIEKEEKLVRDLQSILAHFEELKEIDTEGVSGMTGGTNAHNVFRDDEEENGVRIPRETLLRSLPDETQGFLRVPAVFEE